MATTSFTVRAATAADSAAFATQRVELYREAHGPEAGVRAAELAETTNEAWRSAT